MTSPEARILELYRAFNDRDFDGFFGMLSAQVERTKDTDDSRLVGKDALRGYILDETAKVRAEFAPILVQTLDDGGISVLVQQTILNVADGSLCSDTRVRHTFRLEGDLVVRMDSERDVRAADAHVEPLLTSLYEAIERQDVDAVLALFHPDARIPDSLEQAALVGHDQIRAYYQRQFAAIRVGSSLLATNLLPDGRVEAFLHVLVHGSTGGFWWEGRVTATYRIEDGLITEMVVTEPPGS
mgnify:CR=1 FL=1